MTIKMRIAESEDERTRILQHRYEVLCKELRRYRDTADHRAGTLREDVDDSARHAGAYLRGRLIGSMRWIWGGDAPFPDSYVDRYHLADILKIVPSGQVIIGERIIVSPAHRDRDVISAMFAHLMAFVNEHRIQLIVGRCAPQLLNLYTGLGFRSYSMENINSPEAGYLIPLMLLAEDVDYLREIRSPLAEVLQDFGNDARVPPGVLDIIGGQSAVRSERLSADEDYWRELQTADALSGDTGLNLFEGLADTEIQTVIKNSHLIECRAGDRVLKKRDVAQNMYVVLSGSLEVRDRDQYIATLMRGDVIGEIAFLLSTPRTADVVAMLDGTQLLSLSESTLRSLIDAHPELAARLMLNLSKLLCAKLAFRMG